MTDLDFEIGRHSVEITLGEINFDLSFVVTLDQFIDTLESCYNDEDVASSITKYVIRQAIDKYNDDKVFTTEGDLERFKSQLMKVME